MTVTSSFQWVTSIPLTFVLPFTVIETTTHSGRQPVRTWDTQGLLFHLIITLNSFLIGAPYNQELKTIEIVKRCVYTRSGHGSSHVVL